MFGCHRAMRRQTEKKLTFVLGCTKALCLCMLKIIMLPPAYNIRRMLHSIDINNNNIKRLSDSAEAPHESTGIFKVKMHSQKSHTWHEHVSGLIMFMVLLKWSQLFQLVENLLKNSFHPFFLLNSMTNFSSLFLWIIIM